MKKLKAKRNVKVSLNGKQECISKDQILEYKLSLEEIEVFLSSGVFEAIQEEKAELKKQVKK